MICMSLHIYLYLYQYEPKVSDRPTKTGRQLQSVAKQFGSIGKTVSADENYADANADADEGH